VKALLRVNPEQVQYLCCGVKGLTFRAILFIIILETTKHLPTAGGRYAHSEGDERVMANYTDFKK